MARTHSPKAVRPREPDPAAEAAPTWSGWWGEFQTVQLHAMRDMLAVYNRYVVALAGAHDGQAMAAAFQVAMEDWKACVDGVQHEWLALVSFIPREALSAAGWRLKQDAPAATDATAHAGLPHLFEQSRLGVEMMLRPWLPSTEFDHTEEVVA